MLRGIAGPILVLIVILFLVFGVLMPRMRSACLKNGGSFFYSSQDFGCIENGRR